MTRRLFAEALGTFALVFAGTGAIVIDQATGGAVTHVGVAMTFGLTVMVLIFAIGDVSGAHLNPAVTLGFWLSGRFPLRSVGGYLAAQIAGAVAASGAIRAIFGNTAHLGATLPRGPAVQSFVLEAILTAFLMFVILNVSTGPKETGSFAGIAVGGTILLEAMFAGPVCGASMNPARSLAPAVVSEHLDFLWIYLTAPLLGACGGVLSWIAVRGGDQRCDSTASAEAVSPASQ